MTADMVITVDPATNRELGRYRAMTDADIEAVLAEVSAAQRVWADTAVESRTAVLLRAAAILRARSSRR